MATYKGGIKYPKYSRSPNNSDSSDLNFFGASSEKFFSKTLQEKWDQSVEGVDSLITSYVRPQTKRKQALKFTSSNVKPTGYDQSIYLKKMKGSTSAHARLLSDIKSIETEDSDSKINDDDDDERPCSELSQTDVSYFKASDDEAPNQPNQSEDSDTAVEQPKEIEVADNVSTTEIEESKVLKVDDKIQTKTTPSFTSRRNNLLVKIVESCLSFQSSRQTKSTNGKCRIHSGNLAPSSPDLNETPAVPSPPAKKESKTEIVEETSSTEFNFIEPKPAATCQGSPRRTSWKDRVCGIPSLISKNNKHQDINEPSTNDDIIRFNAGSCGDSDSITSSSFHGVQDFMNKRILESKTSNKSWAANIDSDHSGSLGSSSKNSSKEQQSDETIKISSYEGSIDVSDSSDLLTKSSQFCGFKPQLEYFVQALTHATPNIDNLKEISSLDYWDESKTEEEVLSVFRQKRQKRQKLGHREGKQVSRTSTTYKSSSAPLQQINKVPSPATTMTSFSESEENDFDAEFKNLIVPLRMAIKEGRFDEMFDEMLVNWREKKHQQGVLVQELRYIKLKNIEFQNDFLIRSKQLEMEEFQFNNVNTQVQQTLESLHQFNANCEYQMMNFREINGDLEKLYFETEQLKLEDKSLKDLLENGYRDKELEELCVQWQGKVNFVTSRLEAMLELQNGLKREVDEIKYFIGNLDSVKIKFNGSLGEVTKARQLCIEQRLMVEAKLDSLRKKESLLKEHLEGETRAIAELDLDVRKSEEKRRSWMRVNQYSVYFLDAIHALLYFLLPPMPHRFYCTLL